MRLRLIIPAAFAAIATYTALVRDEHGAQRHMEPAPSPVTPESLARHDARPEPVRPAPALREVPPPAATAPGGVPSIFQDLAPTTLPTGGPTLLDVLAGAPPVEPETAAPAVTSRDMSEEHPSPGGSPVAPTPTDALTFESEEPVPVVVPVPAVAEMMPASPSFTAPLEEGRFALGGWAASAGHSVVSAVTFRKRLPSPAAADRIVLDIDAADNVPEGGLVVLSDPGFAPDREGFTILLAAADPGPFSAAGSYRVLPSSS